MNNKPKDTNNRLKQEENGSFVEEQQAYACWLAGIQRIGNRAKIELTKYAGSPKGVFEMAEKEMRGVLPENKIIELENQKRKVNPVEMYGELKKRNISFFPFLHPAYPEKLKSIVDAPYGIFVEGRLPEKEKPSVAVIGARQCSEYGRFMADMCGGQLAEAGVNVISGMARGIDGISQKAALKAGGMSYSVLGCGTNVCYPAENRNIYTLVKKNGGIISEYPPDTQPRPQQFPPRNRIISGLADVVLIIEARNKSGTLITADMALEQGREVYVVPGRTTDLLSEGCNRLLKQGAGIMISIEEMLEETGLLKLKSEKVKRSHEKEGHAEKRDAETEKILQALDFYPKSIDVLQQETGVEYRKLVYLLMKICIEGKADKVSAGQFIKK